MGTYSKWEIWYKKNVDSDDAPALLATRETYANKETAKLYARNLAKHPAFTNCTLYVHDPENADRFYEIGE